MMISGEVARAVADQWRQTRLDRRAATEAAGVVSDGLTETEMAMKDKASEARVLATQVETTIKVVSTLAAAAAAGASAGAGPSADSAQAAAPKTELAAELGKPSTPAGAESGGAGAGAQQSPLGEPNRAELPAAEAEAKTGAASGEDRGGTIAKNLVKEAVGKVGETFGHLADQASEPLERQGELRRAAAASQAEAADARAEQEIADALRSYVEERTRARLGA